MSGRANKSNEESIRYDEKKAPLSLDVFDVVDDMMIRVSRPSFTLYSNTIYILVGIVLSYGLPSFQIQGYRDALESSPILANQYSNKNDVRNNTRSFIFYVARNLSGAFMLNRKTQSKVVDNRSNV
jgi:hypothetical protein